MPCTKSSVTWSRATRCRAARRRAQICMVGPARVGCPAGVRTLPTPVASRPRGPYRITQRGRSSRFGSRLNGLPDTLTEVHSPGCDISCRLLGGIFRGVFREVSPSFPSATSPAPIPTSALDPRILAAATTAATASTTAPATTAVSFHVHSPVGPVLLRGSSAGVHIRLPG